MAKKVAWNAKPITTPTSVDVRLETEDRGEEPWVASDDDHDAQGTQMAILWYFQVATSQYSRSGICGKWVSCSLQVLRCLHGGWRSKIKGVGQRRAKLVRLIRVRRVHVSLYPEVHIPRTSFRVVQHALSSRSCS